MRNIIICGSSNSGKSYVVSIFRNHPMNGVRYHVPHRFITRPERKRLKTENLENTNITREEFDELILSQKIGPYWTRFMEEIGGKTRTELYGFESETHIQKKTGKAFPKYIYSANNDFIRRMYDNKKSNISTFLENSIIVYVDCPLIDRGLRMGIREDQLLSTNLKEANYRLAEDGKDIKEKADIIINNSKNNEVNVPEEIKNLIKKLSIL